MPDIIRRKTNQVVVGSIPVGGDAPIVIQSMTDTDTASVDDTVRQISELTEAGSEIVRVTVNSPEAARAVPAIKEKLLASNITNPIVGDFHFNGHKLLRDYPGCAESLDKFRINPGNVGRGSKRDAQFTEIIEIACRLNKPVRIGVNWGSLDQALLARLMDENGKLSHKKTNSELVRDALIASVIESGHAAEKIGLPQNKIIVSCKVSDVQELIKVYEILSDEVSYPLHLGLTEAGMGSKGIVASSAALSVLLQQGIGDTIRISLTPTPNGKRTDEVTVAQQILQTMGFRSFKPLVISCPGCGRTSSNFFRVLTEEVQTFVNSKMPGWKREYVGVEEMSIAVMGCVVNGPGESKGANIGISLPGAGEIPVAPVFIDGEKTVTLKGDHIAQDFKELISSYVERRYRREANS